MFQNRENSGKHLLCDIKGITNEYSFSDVMGLMEYICDTYDFQVLHKSYYKFDSKQAFTILFLLGESHFSCHTYPEKQTIALDLYTCREYKDNIEIYSILEMLRSYFQATIAYQIIDREF